MALRRINICRLVLCHAILTVKSFIKFSAALLVALILAYVLVAYVVWKDAPRGDDVTITRKIHRQIAQALETNFVGHIDVIVTPYHEKTVILVKTMLSEEDKRKLSDLANETSRRNSG